MCSSGRSFSGRCRAVISEGMSFAHLIDAIDGVLRRLGGTSRAWRTDSLGGRCSPGMKPRSPLTTRESGSVRLIRPSGVAGGW